MKNNLFQAYDNADHNLNLAINHRNQVIHNFHQGVYNYYEKVPYTHKFKVGGGGFWTRWVWKTETRYRDELRTDVNRYNNDLNNANVAINQAQQHFNNCERAIVNQIQSMQQQVNSFNLQSPLQSQKNSNLLKVKNLLISKLSSSTSNNYKLQQEISNKQNVLAPLNKIVNNINNYSNKIVNVKAAIENTNNEIVQKKLTLEQKLVKSQSKKSELAEKISQMSEIDRAKLAYEMLITNNQQVYEILEEEGFALECVADIAFSKSNWDVFEGFCMARGIDFDGYKTSDGKCLATKILLSDNESIITKMLEYQGGSLNNTVLQCASDSKYISCIEKLYNHDKQLFAKNYVGISVLEAVIWSENLALLDYIVEHEALLLSGKTISNESYLHLALRYGTPEIIKIISQNVDAKTECDLLFKNHEYKLFELALKHGELSQNDLKDLYIKTADVFKFYLSEICINRIKDVDLFFKELVIKSEVAAATYLFSARPDVFTNEVLMNICSEFETSSDQYQFVKSCSEKNSEIENVTHQNHEDYEMQNIGEVVYEDN